MKYLLIDTSTDVMVLMLHENNKLIDKIFRKGKSDHQAFIVPLIDELLKKNKTDIKEIDEFVIGIGPGSYTGLRVGLMTAKMLSYTLNKPLMKISSLAFLASGYDDELIIWHDARNNDGFQGVFKKGELIGEESVRNLNDLSEEEKNKLLIIKEDTINIDSNRVIKNAILVKDVFAIVPNYLRKTEAENKLDQESRS
ncbi:tRNA (adenosine(37)-N6)-threonylcarbamoyltransferase complex dimerization subunit type 1 TsaB [Acholeplasma hippikon]|uniref:Protease-like protein n=1 Tax=Acholeplasma hippikon TaxID=264636 RepID=A0A449BKY6_9MOLU|nr:tRNA (adenosine(37)-N6)-threonylcarbamoyltransferase complex dimerization subunit type 1 TsaB [Acholeplasma hippikon]VEU83090.1 protease-like protein [Acholeplasma hippikon]